MLVQDASSGINIDTGACACTGAGTGAGRYRCGYKCM